MIGFLKYFFRSSPIPFFATMIFVSVRVPCRFVLMLPIVNPSPESLSFQLPARPLILVEFWISIEIPFEDTSVSSFFSVVVVVSFFVVFFFFYDFGTPPFSERSSSNISFVFFVSSLKLSPSSVPVRIR